MRIILFTLAAVLHTTASQRCDSPNIKRDTSMYYKPGYGHIHHQPCDFNITVDIWCQFPRTGEYVSPTDLCPNDRIRLHFYSDYIDVLLGSSFETDFKITELILDNLYITKITPGAFNHQYTIQSISLKKNNISKISDGIFTSLAHLEVLDLSENQIMDVDEDAFSSVPLKKLNLSRNAVSSIPGSLAGVDILDMSYNSIKSLPSKVFSTGTLNVSNNKIQRINLSYFPNIKKLYIASNSIEELELPENIKELEVLNVGTNRISSLPNKTIVGDNLRELYLKANNITNIPVAFLKKFKKLEVLDLSKNGLSFFYFGTFDGLQSLKTLNISYNNFKDLPLYMFHSMKDLRNLYFSHNELTDINVEDLLKYVPKLQVADIRGYTLSCSKLLEVVHKLGTHNVSVVHGSFTEGNNIYGMNCTEVDDSVSVKEKSIIPEINEAYAALLNYFNKEFRNSNFVQYLENLKNVGNKSEDLSLLSNFTDILAETKRFTNELIKTGKVQTGVLEKIMNMLNETKTKDEMIYKLTANNSTNINEDIVKSLKQILNYTKVADQRRDEELKELFKVLRERLEVQYKPPVTHQVPDDNMLETPSSQDQKPQQHTIHEAAQLSSSADNVALGGYPPVLTFMAVLLTIITALLFVFGYVVFTRAKYVVHPNSDVEMAGLVESKPDTVNS